MKKMDRIHRKIVRFIRRQGCFVFFMLICLYPAYGRYLGHGIKKLTGVFVPAKAPVFSEEAILDGSWQETANAWFQENIPGRKLLIRLRNELLYSVFHTSSNRSVVIGRDGSLCEPDYLYRWNSTGAYREGTDEELEQMTENLVRFQELLRSRGKELYLFIVPTKPRFVKNVFPWFMDPEDHPDPDQYTRMKKLLSGTDIPVVDAVEWMEENEGLLESPYFSRLGVHWDTSWALAACSQLIERINADGKYDLGHLSVKAKPTSKIVFSHDDMYQLLNVLREPEMDDYAPVTKVTLGGNIPNVLFRGDSFMYQCFRIPCRKGLFGDYYYLENVEHKVFGPKGKTKTDVISSWDAYDEIDLRGILKKTDIVVLECTESTLQNYGMGFAEYILQNPQLLTQEEN